jgi:hypothetical protein
LPDEELEFNSEPLFAEKKCYDHDDEHVKPAVLYYIVGVSSLTPLHKYYPKKQTNCRPDERNHPNAHFTLYYYLLQLAAEIPF